ncbi:MAG: argininosuccinate lyase [Vannielia sp.]|nr:argininosuccinate lyase [Oceanicola sp. 502str15]MCO6385044.1 argininosuccinate lyase [Oceanicola sp. 502str15]
MRAAFALAALLALSACGVDGEPEPPVAPGVHVSGTVKVGVRGGSGL